MDKGGRGVPRPHTGWYSQGNQRLKRCVLRRLWKTDSDGADVTGCADCSAK